MIRSQLILEFVVLGRPVVLVRFQRPAFDACTNTFTQHEDIVRCLEQCHAATTIHTLNALVERLPQQIRVRIVRSSKVRQYLTNIVTTVGRFPGGLRALRDAVGWCEGDSYAFRDLDALLAPHLGE